MHTLSRTVCAEQAVASHLCWPLVTVCNSASKLVGMQPASLIPQVLHAHLVVSGCEYYYIDAIKHSQEDCWYHEHLSSVTGLVSNHQHPANKGHTAS